MLKPSIAGEWYRNEGEERYSLARFVVTGACISGLKGLWRLPRVISIHNVEFHSLRFMRWCTWSRDLRSWFWRTRSLEGRGGIRSGASALTDALHDTYLVECICFPLDQVSARFQGNTPGGWGEVVSRPRLVGLHWCLWYLAWSSWGWRFRYEQCWGKMTSTGLPWSMFLSGHGAVSAFVRQYGLTTYVRSVQICLLKSRVLHCSVTVLWSSDSNFSIYRISGLLLNTSSHVHVQTC